METIVKARDKIMPHVDDTTKSQLADLIAALESVEAADEPAARRALELAVREHSYLL
jgi:hypothetical protein